jgi:hypothetical protein
LRLSGDGRAEDLFTRLDDTRFNLIVIGQPVPAALPDLQGLLVTHHVPEDPVNDAELRRAGVPKPSFYLLRPDCHIGLAGARLDISTLTQYVAERLKLRS